MKHKILPSSPADLEGIARANEFIAVDLLGWVCQVGWYHYHKDPFVLFKKEEINFFTTMQDVSLLDNFCNKNWITWTVKRIHNGDIELEIDAHPTETRGRYRKYYSYTDTPLAYALAYGILEFYLEVIYEK